MGPVSWLLYSSLLGFIRGANVYLSEGPKYMEKETKAYLEEEAQVRYPFAVWR